MRPRYAIAAAALVVAAALSLGACSGGKRQSSGVLRTEDDSVAYVIGMHLGRNLAGMDTLLNVDAVCEGLRDAFTKSRKIRFTDNDARDYYLRFVNHTRPERLRAYEERFLTDFRRENRTYARTKSGLTYSVDVVGDETTLPRNDFDTVTIRYVAKHQDGRTFHSSYERGDTLRTAVGDMREGVREAIRLTSKGGKISVWVPSALAYGMDGDRDEGIAPNETLFYEIELLDISTGNRYSPRTSTGSRQKNI